MDHNFIWLQFDDPQQLNETCAQKVMKAAIANFLLNSVTCLRL